MAPLRTGPRASRHPTHKAAHRVGLRKSFLKYTHLHSSAATRYGATTPSINVYQRSMI